MLTTIMLLTVVATPISAQAESSTAPSDAGVAIKSRLAILEPTVSNAMPDDNIEHVIKRLYFVVLETGRYNVVDRGQLKRLMDGLTPKMQRCAEPFCAAEIGRMLSVDKVLLADVSKVDLVYELTVKLVNASSGKVEQTHVERVAGNMNDVAQVGTLCAVQALHAEKKQEYQKGDWRKVRSHGPGFRLSFVMPGMQDPFDYEHAVEDGSDSTVEYKHSFDGTITVAPTAGLGLHYDVAFRFRNGTELHYTPNVEAWFRWGDRSGEFKSYGEVGFNVADFRYLFGSTSDRKLTFFVGLGPTLLLNIFYDERPMGYYETEPFEDATFVRLRAGGNVMAGLEYSMQRIPWRTTAELKLKLLDPIAFKVSIGFTRPLGGRAEAEEEAPGAEPETEPANTTDDEWPGL